MNVLREKLKIDVATVSAAIGCGAFASYALRAAPTAWLLDSSELVATPVRLALSHPPGHPAYMLVAALSSLIPFGNAALRIHLFCAACVAVSAALVPLTLDRMGAIRSRGSLGLAAAASIAAVVSSSWSFQAIRAEVYALELLSLAVATWAVVEPRDKLSTRSVALAAIALATGLLNHHYITFFAFPAVALVVVARSGGVRGIARNVGVGVVFGAVGLLGYAYLAAASAGQPWPSWRWVTDADSAWWTISAAAFQKTAANAAHIDPAAGLQSALGLLTAQLTPLGLLAMGAGAFGLARVRPALGAFVVLAIVGNLLTQVLFDFDPYNPDVGGYFMYSVFCSALLVGCVGLFDHDEASRGFRLGLGAVAGLIATLALLISGGGTQPTLAANRSSTTLLEAQMGAMPPRSTWVTTYFETLFYAWYAQAVEDRRPDVVHLHRAWRTYPGYDAMFAARWPAEADALDVDGQRGAIAPEWLARRAAIAPVYVEPESLVRPEEVATAAPSELAFVIGAPSPEPEALSLAMDGLAEALDVDHNEQASRILLWTWFHQARLLLETGRPELARVAAAHATTLSPDDPELHALNVAIERAIAPAP